MRVTCFVGGKRTGVSTEEATALVGRFERESDGHEVYKVDLSCRSWNRAAFDILQPFLAKNASTVRFANFADIIASLMTDEGLGVTEKLSETFESSDLVEINLNDNAMGPRGLVRVASLFKNSNLERLYLSNCGLSAESMDMLKEYVSADDGRIAKSLKELVLDRNMMGTEGAKKVGEIIALCKNLEYFSYCGCRPIKEGTAHLAKGILGLTVDCQPALRRLDLEDCTFGSGEDDEDAIIPFAQAMKKCTQMVYLNLQDGDLEVEGLKLLVASLTEARARLTHLYIDGFGELGQDGARVLSDFLEAQATSLRCLSCNLNELGNEGTATLMEAFSACNNTLEELSLQQNEIEKEGAEAIVRALLPNIKTINLEDNDDMPTKAIKQKYGDKAILGDADDDDDGDEPSDDIENLITMFDAATKL